MEQIKQKSSFEKSELLDCGEGKLFGQGNAQLPLPNMLMLDRIQHISDQGGCYDKGEIIAELDINPNLWFFECHFPGDPVMPGCLGLDAITPTHTRTDRATGKHILFWGARRTLGVINPVALLHTRARI